MFWNNKKKVVAGGAAGGPKIIEPGQPEEKEKIKLEMVKEKSEKLSGPRQLSGPVNKVLVGQYKIPSEMADLLKMVVVNRAGGEDIMDYRVFDPAEAEAKDLTVRNYHSLDDHPEMILHEGWFEKDSKKVELVEKRKMEYDVPIFSKEEIRNKIEELKEPGGTVFFYQDAGPAAGGPLGRGASVVELNPNHPKHGKKYIVYSSNMFGKELIRERSRLWESNDPKKIAEWVKRSHSKRVY